MRSSWSLALGSTWLAVLLAQKPVPPTLTASPSPEAAPGVVFTDATAASGLGAFRHVSGSAAKDYILEATGSGVALFDYDGDGWLDVYLVNGSTLPAVAGREAAPAAALFRNGGDGTFTDATSAAGVENRRWGQGVCAGDFDNDGAPDLYVANFGRTRLFRNGGDGTFTDVAERAGVAVDKWSTGCAFGDYDGDGRLDLFVAGYVRLDPDRLPPAPPRPGASRETVPSPPPAAERRGMGAAYSAGAPYCEYRTQPVMCGPRGLVGEADHLFRNNGDGTFTDVSARAGVSDGAGLYGFGVAFLDYDDDGKLDLFVANDSQANYLYRNRGDGTFEDLSYASGAALNESGQEQAHMGVAVGDYDNDGRPDLYVTNFADDYNVLYHNDGRGLFSDVSYPAGVARASIPFLGWGDGFLDYDNDGWLDLVVANGHVYPIADRFDWNTSYRQRALLFRNLKGRFVEVAGSAGPAMAVARAGRGLAVGDLDNDGDVDVVINNLDEGPTLLRNDGGSAAGHWLVVRLVGDPARGCPRDAIGSVVYCTAGGIRRRGEVASGRSQVSQSDLRVHFGLGAATRIDRLEVRWANGPATSYAVPAVDRLVVIDQARGVLAAAPAMAGPR
ncbi:MAG TPA: CRTAC1 family protein [Vicinamibacteria bacterium]|nr:CRTAC1 family protein [Vicinamibacteria bacterium]